MKRASQLKSGQKIIIKKVYVRVKNKRFFQLKSGFLN